MAARKTHPSSHAARAAEALPQSPVPSPVALPPAIGMALPRERLHALIDARLPGAVWLQGPTGAGKTVLLRSWLHGHRHPSTWLSVDERHRDPAALFAAFTAVSEPACTSRLPVFSPEHRDDPDAFARDYFGRLDQALPDGHALVVDDIHHLAGATGSLLALAIDRFGGRRMLCFASQLMPDAAFAPHIAGSRLWIVGHRLLAFDRAEASELATRLGATSPVVDDLVAATDGWAAGLMLAMQFGAGGDAKGDSDDPLGAVRTPLALLIAGQVLGGVAADDLVKLRLFAELPQVPMELVDVAPEWSSAGQHLQRLAERGLFVERLAADRRATSGKAHSPNTVRIGRGCWRLHDLFRTALREPGALGDPDPPLGRRLTAHLLELGRLDLAWQLAARLETALLSDAVSTHGNDALADTSLPAMLQMAQPHAGRASPTIAIWYARGSIGTDDRAALQACEEAFRGFDDAGDEHGVALSIALAAMVVFAMIENVGDMAIWVERFRRVDRKGVDDGVRDDVRAIRIAGEVVHDLMIGGRSASRDDESLQHDCLAGYVASEVLSANETIVAGSLLVAAMSRAIRLPEVELVVLRVQALPSYGRSAPHIRASWTIENGYHFLKHGAFGRARPCFADALVIADDNALLQPRIAALIGLARVEIGLNDIHGANALIDQLDAIGPERLARQHGWVVHLRARIAALRGRAVDALELIDRAEQLIVEAGFPPPARVILSQDRVQMLYASGAVEESQVLAKQVMAGVSESDGRRIGVTSGLLVAHGSWADDEAAATVHLRREMATARSLKLMTFVPLLPDVAAQIAARALRAGITEDFVKQVIEARGLPAPKNAPSNWPWPIRIEVLGPFRIVRRDEPLTFVGKAQQKPLELLKYLACTRDLMADAANIGSALWPDADDGPARKSLEVTISRLRRLLDDDTLVVVREGKVSLDVRRVSSDAREFIESTLEAEAVAFGRHARSQVAETGRALIELLVELPLEHEEPTAWREAVRERYRTAFVRAVRALIVYWQQSGDSARAIALIDAAIAREPLAESLYRMLMQIHLDACSHNEAMRVYRQCRQMLSILIGSQPSVETERIRKLINL